MSQIRRSRHAPQAVRDNLVPDNPRRFRRAGALWKTEGTSIARWSADDHAVVAGVLPLAPWMTITCPTVNRSSRDGAATVNVNLGADAARAYSEDGATRGLLLEKAIVNPINQTDFNIGWSLFGTNIVSADVTPAGTTENCVATDDDAGATERPRLTITGALSESTDYMISAWMWVDSLSAGLSQAIITLTGASGGTAIAYALRVAPNFSVPGFLRRQAEKQIVQAALRGLRLRAEEQAAAG